MTVPIEIYILIHLLCSYHIRPSYLLVSYIVFYFIYLVFIIFYFFYF